MWEDGVHESTGFTFVTSQKVGEHQKRWRKLLAGAPTIAWLQDRRGCNIAYTHACLNFCKSFMMCCINGIVSLVVK